MKLKQSEIKPFRQRQLIKQNNCCSLCGDPVAENQAVLDHCHKTGVLRGVLHRGCNSLLGKIENTMPRSLVDINRLANISKNLIKYLTADAVSEFLHPTYLTQEERKMKQAMGRGKGKKPPKR